MRTKFFIPAIAIPMFFGGAIGFAGENGTSSSSTSSRSITSTSSTFGVRTFTIDQAVQTALQQNPDVLRARFPSLRGPSSDDICYATANRQQAVREVARDAEVVLVAGSQTSSNSKRLVEVAEREGARAYLVDDETEVDVTWLQGVSTVGVTAGASAPERIVDRLVGALAALGPIEVEERTTTRESIQFKLPKELVS